MTLHVSRWALMVLAVVVMGIFLPLLYQTVLDRKTGKTQLFFSPVIKKFVYREMVGEGDQFVTRDEDGNEYDREAFECLIPFVYYKNMDLWGKLPLKIGNHTFTREQMKANRQVFEFKPQDIQDRRPRVPVYPLLESEPGVAGLRFPKDAFRMTVGSMEFFNVDTNQVEKDLSLRFTQTLGEAGFQFPAILVSGKVSILKPFNEGFFLMDARNQVFHVKRVKGQAVVVKTPISTSMGVRAIKVSENNKREILGMLLTNNDELFLISYDDYRLIKLPLEGYGPDTMDFKLLINPLYRAAVYSDDQMIRAVAMDNAYTVVGRYQHEMFSGKKQAADRVFDALFPFHIQMRDPTSGYLQFRLVCHGWPTVIGVGVALILGALIMGLRRISLRTNWSDMVFILFTGLYGLVAVNLIEPEG